MLFAGVTKSMEYLLFPGHSAVVVKAFHKVAIALRRSEQNYTKL